MIEIIINNNDFYNKNIFVPRKQDCDLMTYEAYKIPEFTLNLNTINGKWVNYYGMVADPKFKGIFLKTSDTNFRIMLGMELEQYLYRGENSNKYSYFQPSLHREEGISRCIEELRQIQFRLDFLQSPYYKRLSQMNVYNYHFDFDLEALAQHYEFKTNYLDLTRSRDVAEFFAYTYIDNGEYKPITDFDKYHPTLYKAKIYDVINYNPNILQIVGFQAALRPVKQQAMALNLINGDKEIRDKIFEKIELEQSEKKSIEIYNKFNKGKDLFPDDILSKLEFALKKRELAISEDALFKYSKINKKSFYKLKSFVRHNTNLKIKTNYKSPIQQYDWDMNNEISNGIIPWIVNNIGWRNTSANIRPK